MKKLLNVLKIMLLMLAFSSCYSNKTFTSLSGYQSCMIYKHNEYTINDKNDVYLVATKHGDTIFFNREYPGKVSPEGVYGYPEILFPFDNVDSLSYDKKYLESVWKNGKKYQFLEQTETGYLCLAKDTLIIPLTEIVKIEVKKYNKKRSTILKVSLVAIPVAFVVSALTGGFVMP